MALCWLAAATSAGEHLEDIYYRPSVCIVAVVDQNLEKAELTKSRYAAAFCGADYRLFLSREYVSIVIIATNVDSHLSILQDGVCAGKHVLCKKIAGNIRIASFTTV